MKKRCAPRKVAFILSAAVWPAAAFGQSSQTIRGVTYNIQGDVSTSNETQVIPQIATVLEGIGQQKYSGDGILEMPDFIGLQETASNSINVAPIAADLNTYYRSNYYSYSTVQGTQFGSITIGNGPNALIYNQYKMNLMASVGVGTPQGVTNGEYRQIMRYEMQPLVDAGTSAGIFYVYVDHYKSGGASTQTGSSNAGTLTTDGAVRALEAAIVRNDEASLPASAAVLYVGDYNVDGSQEAMYQTLTAVNSPGGVPQGRAYDPLNPMFDYTQTWQLNSTYQGIMTESDNDLRYRDDLITMTGNVYTGTAGVLNLITKSYHAFGNDGSTGVYGNISGNSSLNDIVGNSYPGVATLTTSQVFSAMNPSTGSDHLPVVADFSQVIPQSAEAWVGNFNGGRTWNSPLNWNFGAIPNQANAFVSFGPSNTAAAVVTLDGGWTAGTVNFASSNAYTLSAGSGGSLALDNGASLAAVNVLIGAHTISAPLILNSTAQVSFISSTNALTLGGGISGAGGLSLAGPGTLHLAANTHTSTIGSLSINSGAAFDIGNNALAINFGSPASDPVAAIVPYIQSGYAGGLWTGAGISSSTAATNPSALAVGYADGNIDVGTPAAANQLLIKYTLLGDANLDGLVNFQDLVAVVQNFNKGATDWATGNFLFQSSTNFQDLVAVVQNFNKVLSPAGSSGEDIGGGMIPLGEFTQVAPNGVPEPCGLLLATIGMAAMMRRRRR